MTFNNYTILVSFSVKFVTLREGGGLANHLMVTGTATGVQLPKKKALPVALKN